MSEQKKIVPKRRFKEYQKTNAWEQRMVKDICNISTGKSNTQDRIEDGIYPFYVRSPIIERSNRYLYDEEAVLTVGDGVGTGKVYHYVNGKYDLHQRVYRMFDFKNGALAKYFYHYFSNHFYDRVMAMTAKTSVDSVRYEMISEMDIAIPSEKEQAKIIGYLDNLDNLITLHQRKLEKAKALKSAYLSEMFPADGECEPRRRFAGFTDAWEQRKVGDIGAIRTCKRIFKEQTKEEGDIPFYKNGTLGLKADAYIARDIYEEYKKLYPFPKVGDVLMSVVGSIGRTAEYKGNDEYFQDSNIVWLDTDSNVIDKRFLQISYQIIDWIIEGSTIKHLYNDNILASRIWMTSLDEQRKIGEYFHSLDHLITLHQRKLEKLQSIKKAYLNEMFV